MLNKLCYYCTRTSTRSGLHLLLRKCQGEAVFFMKLKANLFSMTMSNRDIYLPKES